MSVTLLKSGRQYSDLDFSMERHPLTNNVSIKQNIASVKQSIINLLLLKSGDKPFHPEIKSPIYDYLFEGTSSIVQIILEGEVRTYLGVFEPRVDVTLVKISFPNSNTLQCLVFGDIINLSEPITVNILVSRLR
jgi:phage baseplate assembly protein W